VGAGKGSLYCYLCLYVNLFHYLYLSLILFVVLVLLMWRLEKLMRDKWRTIREKK
jgi:hypothetical protein